MVTTEPCAVCGVDATAQPYDQGGEPRIRIDCPRCGEFRIDPIAVHRMPKDRVIRTQLSSWIRHHKEVGREPPLILRSADRILDLLPTYRVAEKQRLLLGAIARRTSNPAVGAQLVLEEDYPLAWALDVQELGYLLDALSDRGLLEVTPWVDNDDRQHAGCRITASGWDYLDERATDETSSRKVFVAMWFDARMDAAWLRGIEPTLSRLGYDAVRVDKVEHLDRIDAKIQADIKESRFVVADVTGQRQGVYFEAGYAMGLGLPVVWCVHEDELQRVHFDTRQFNHIVWADAEDLGEQLAARVVAVIGRLQNRTPR